MPTDDYGNFKEFVEHPENLECIHDQECCFYMTYRNTKGKTFRVGFDKRQLPFCCGVKEVGSLKVDSNFPVIPLSKLLDALVSENNTLVINTNGVGASVKFEAALSLCNNWTKVKKFKNDNSKNTITIWISNNE